MRIAILGTRGIPNRYGGFEQCAEYLARGLVARGHEVIVYNSSSHDFQEKEFHGVQIVHCYDPEERIGTAGQFIYDLNCILHARRQKLDIALHLGYTSSSVWSRLWPGGKTRNLVNMDGLEWKRSKYSGKVQRFLKKAEAWAAKNADLLIADSIGIQQYLKEKYGRSSVYIPYGAVVEDVRIADLPWELQPYQYAMILARMEPENNIEMILQGYLDSQAPYPIIVVGNATNSFGQKMQALAVGSPNVRFVGGVYDQVLLTRLRAAARLYFHGHSVGGTNPSLLEAMGSGALIAAHRNPFNETILKEGALYFSNKEEVSKLLQQDISDTQRQAITSANRQKIAQQFRWDQIVDAYETAMREAINNKLRP